MLRPSSNHESIGIESDSRKAVSVGFNINRSGEETGGWSRGWAERPLPAGIFAGNLGRPELRSDTRPCTYVDTFVDPVAADTYGSRYVFSTLDQKEFSLQTGSTT